MSPTPRTRAPGAGRPSRARTEARLAALVRLPVAPVAPRRPPPRMRCPTCSGRLFAEPTPLPGGAPGGTSYVCIACGREPSA